MGSINKVQLMGRLGDDPEVRTLNSGDKCVTIRLATSETWRDKQTGERRERTSWHNVVIFNQALAKIAEQYLAKGNLCYVEGMLATRSWEDQSGQKRYATEVVLKAFKGDLQLMPQGGGARSKPSSADDYGQSSGRSEASASAQTGSTGSSPGMQDTLDDEIPF